MAGHSAWANIKHRKAAQDKKRGKIFTKMIKEITVAAKVGLPDPDANPRLRSALQMARKHNVPKDNIEKALSKANSSEGMKEITYEGYGPEGVAIYIECATDNLTRTIANIRSYFNKYEGSLGKDGCLQFVFERKAVFSFLKNATTMSVDDLTLELIDDGVDEVDLNQERITVYGSMSEFGKIQKKLEDLKIEIEESGLDRIPLNTKEVGKNSFDKIMKLVDALEEDDDVQKVYHNIEFNESHHS